MADNRKIRNKIRGENGKHYAYGMEDQLAAAYDQERLDQLKRSGAIEGDWRSAKSAMVVTGDASSKAMSGKLAASGAATVIDGGGGGGGKDFKPLSIEKTIEAMRKMDFSETVTRSMTFHGDALKQAIEQSNRSKSESPAKTELKDDAGDFPEGFPPIIRAKLEKMGKTFAEIKTLDREKLIELDGIAEKSAGEILEFLKIADQTGDK